MFMQNCHLNSLSPDNCYQLPFLANFFQEEEPNTVASKGVKVRPARPGVKPANKQLRTSVGDKVKCLLSHCSLQIIDTPVLYLKVCMRYN